MSEPSFVARPSHGHEAAGPGATFGRYPLLLRDLLRSGLTRSPDEEIVYRDLARFTYRELADRVARLASGLIGLGVRPGDTVGMLDWDSHRYLEAYFAVPGLGATLHMVNVRLSPDQILYTINHAEDDVLLVHADFLPMLEATWARIERPVKIIALSDSSTTPVAAIPIEAEYEELLRSTSPGYRFGDLDENTRATIFYTTGTTGPPKGVFFSHRQLVLHTLSVAAALGTAAVQGRLHRADVYMPITPMFHVHAWGLPFVATMLGIKQVYPGRYAADTLLGLIEAEEVTFSHCVPTLLHMLLTSDARAEVDLRGWKVIIGGSSLSAGLAQAALERGIDVFTGYGMSETCPILTLAQLSPAMLDEGTAKGVELRTQAGSPVPLLELGIVDEDMSPLPHDGQSAGEIVVRAPWLTEGYVKDPAATEALWRGGHLHTGDVGQINIDGTLRITDRAKDVIKTGGEWISSLQLEDLISRNDDVDEVGVISVPDAKWGERPLAVVVARPGCDPATIERDILANLHDLSSKGELSKWAIPAHLTFASSLPKTSVGKIDKKELRKLFGADYDANRSS